MADPRPDCNSYGNFKCRKYEIAIRIHGILGLPGWNNLAYGNNAVTSGVDYQGTGWVLQPGTASAPTNTTDSVPILADDGRNVHYAIRDGHELKYAAYTVTTTTYTRGATTYSGNWTGTPSKGDTRTAIWYYDKRVTVNRYETGRWDYGANYEYTGPFTSDTTTTNAYSRTFTYVYE